MVAEKIIRENVLWAGGGGLIPVPVLDILAITAVELKMLKELSALYGLSFQEDQVKNILFFFGRRLGCPNDWRGRYHEFTEVDSADRFIKWACCGPGARGCFYLCRR